MKRLQKAVVLVLTFTMLLTAVPVSALALTEEELLYQPADEADTLFQAKEPVEFEPADWQGNLPEDMWCGLMTIPWSHDSGTYNIQFERSQELYDAGINLLKKTIEDKVYGVFGEALAYLADKILSVLEDPLKIIAGSVCDSIQRISGQCQYLTIKEQLECGVRGLDLRYRYDNGEFNIYHGDETKGIQGIFQTCYCYDKDGSRLNLEKCFTQIAEFLEEHPTEFVVMNVSNEGGEYDRNVESALVALEESYGISREIKNYPKKEIGKFTYGSLRGSAFDITGRLLDATDGSWNATVDQKLEILKNRIFDPQFSADYLKKCECNIAVKIWNAHDPNNECTCPIDILWTSVSYLPFDVPCGLVLHLQDGIKSPHDQSVKVNAALLEMLDEAASASRLSVRDPGLIGIDFVNEDLCWAVANYNGVRHWYVPQFIHRRNNIPVTLWDTITEKFELDKETVEKILLHDRHRVEVTGGFANVEEAYADDGIMLIADEAPEGRIFSRWIVLAGDVQLEDEYSPQCGFIMPDNDVKIDAYFAEDVPELRPVIYVDPEEIPEYDNPVIYIETEDVPEFDNPIFFDNSDDDIECGVPVNYHGVK